jgi:hypothetical protein
MDHGLGASGKSGAASTTTTHPGVTAHTSAASLSNTHLDTSLTKALGKSGVTIPGGDLKSACGGFGNLGQCVAALHVSQNLDLPGGFPALKNLTTGDNPLSLGKAIQKLDPNAKADAAAEKAKHQADTDLHEAGET